jgi:hypothetical protein
VNKCDHSFGRLGPRRGVMIHFNTWVGKGAQHPQRMRHLVMVTFGVHIREQGITNKEGILEDNEREKSYMVLTGMKRASSLKKTIHSTWEDLCFLEEDLVDRVGISSLGMILGKYGSIGLLEACVR